MFQRRRLTVNLLSVWLLLLLSDCEGNCYNGVLRTPQGAERTSPDQTLFSHTGDIVRFHCKRGYHFVGTGSESFFVNCSSDGNWVKNFQGYCESDCSSNQFQCKSSGKCIDLSSKCNCVPDCDDRSDEGGCDTILIDVTGKSQGILKSPGFPAGYPGRLSCTYKIITHDVKHRIKLQFTDFHLRPARGIFQECADYVDLSNEYYAGNAMYTCEYSAHCVFCGSTKPSTSFSDDNYITMKFRSGNAASSVAYKGFSATWYNERISMTSGGRTSNDGNNGGGSYHGDTTTDNPNVMHGTSIFLLVFLPMITIFGVTFTYLRWRARLAHYRARSQQLARIGLVTAEVGPAVEEPAPIFNGNSAFGPRLPSYSETPTPLEPPPPYEADEETNTNGPAASREAQLPPTHDSTAVTIDSHNENGSTSNDPMGQAGTCVEPEGTAVVVQN